MSEFKDPAIKLFGRTIPLQETQITHLDLVDKSDTIQSRLNPVNSQQDKEDRCRETAKAENDVSHLQDTHNKVEKPIQDMGKENHSKENKVVELPKIEEDQSEDCSAGQDKLLKKPDKILPCPRCNSLDTKFCYYNNYNVNQPRHFCKNCQRYWTAGGTMRNVPVGAGRRKNKHIVSQYRHLMMSSEGIPASQVYSSESADQQLQPGEVCAPSMPLKGNGTVLKFGSDAPLCESMSTVLNLGDQNKDVEMSPVVCVENGEEPSSCGSATSVGEEEMLRNGNHMGQGSIPNCIGVISPPPQMPCYPGPPWAYPWAPGWNNVAAMSAPRCSSDNACGTENGNPRPVQWASMSMLAAPPAGTPSIPIPFIPASYWGCMPGWAARAWNMPWIGTNGSISPSSSPSNSGCSSNGSPTLGKHSRDVGLQGEEKAEKCLWVPKTLRIDDPDDAMKSSIWATLGIKPDQKEPITKGGIFKAFSPKAEPKDQASDADEVLQANPAALSRSKSFQETT